MGKKIFDIRERSFKFGVDIVRLIKSLPRNSLGFVLGDQLLRSGTSVGANIEEAQNSSSKKEFIRGLTIALKEARETEYWLKLINEANVISKAKTEGMKKECRELIKILTTIVKRSKA